MVALRVTERWRAAGGAGFALYLAAVLAGMIRVADQPSATLDLGGSSASLVPTDLVFAALAVLTVVRLGRTSIHGAARLVLLVAAAFTAWLLLTAVPNGADAIVGAGRLVELGILALATPVFVERAHQLWLVLGLLLLVALASVAFALVEFVGDPGVRRQASFLGEHDLAALCVTVTATGLAGLFARTPSRWLVWPVIVLGGVGAVLAATLASLVGLYLAAAAVVLVAAVRASFRWQGALATVLVVVAVSAGTLEIRSGDLGFLQVLAGKQEQEPGQFAASWSQRLVYAYVALRVFEDNPIVGTGWYPLLPPDEFARYVPDARARFDNQPANYFPPTNAPYIPQQAPDQILAQLGLVGAALFLALGAALARAATGAARAWPRDRDELLAYVPGAWLGSLVGALCGAALFGGTPIAALFWLTLGVIAAVSRLLPDPAIARVPGHRVSEAVR